MDTTKLLIERCKTAIGEDCSDYRLAKVLKVSHTTLLHWRNGRTRPDDLTIIEMAKIIGCDPGRVVATMHAERAKDPQTRALWLSIAANLPRSVAAVLFSVICAMFFIAPSPALARVPGEVCQVVTAPSVHYVK